jgi:UDP-N-acetylmuramyl pentapeptide phosphotransferase/UDP-N-acetylglucosamine-1-phosphate transferase
MSRRTAPASSDLQPARTTTMNIPTPLAGTVTIFFLVGFGIFIYPALFRRRGGVLIVALITAALAALFFFFDEHTGTPRSTSLVLALVWAGLPIVTGIVVGWLQRERPPGGA